MQEPLGLSIGTTNMVAARSGSPPVTRRTVLTLFPHRAPEIGLPAENPNLTESGTVVSGFVERIGDSAELFSADGSTHDPELLLVEALDAMISAAGADAASSEITIAVPAHWGQEALRSLRNGLRTHSGFVRSGLAPRLASDALTALTAINSSSGLPARGVVGLLDFGGGGTNLTLTNAASDFEPIGKTVRYREFSGDQIDHALLAHVVNGMGQAKSVDPAATAAVGLFTQLREECRQAKERLSTEMVTELAVDPAGYRSRIQITRAELENLIANPLSGVVSAFGDLLVSNKIDWGDLVAVVTVGGCASIPLIAQRLSSHTRTSVITAVQPAFSMAVGAAMFASRETALEEAPATAMAGAVTGPTTGIAGLPPIDVLPYAHDPETVQKLAWSEDEDTGNEPVPYNGDFYGVNRNGNGNGNGHSTGRPTNYLPDEDRRYERDRGRYSFPRLLFGLSALVAMISIGGVAYSLSSTVEHKAPPSPTSSNTVAPPPPLTSSAAPSPSLMPTPSVVPSPSSPEPPPPSPSRSPTASPPPVTTTNEAPETTTTQPTTTRPTTTEATATTTTTTEAPPPSTTTPTTTTVPMTTEYLTLPLVPVPIPIQVPQR